MADSFESISIADIPESHPVLRFDAFWRAATKDNKSVNWEDFNPMEMAPVLPWMLVLDCLPDNDYMFRVSGTGCEMIFDRKLTGSKFSDQVEKSWAKARYEDLLAVKSGAGPLYAKGNLPVKGRDHVKIFRGLYGFTSGGIEIDRLVVVVAPPSPSPIAL